MRLRTRLKYRFWFRLYQFLRWTHEKWPPKDIDPTCALCHAEDLSLGEHEDLPLGEHHE